MPHSDDDTLSLLALGELIPAADLEHVADCDQCTRELGRLSAVVSGVRAGTGFGEPLPDPIAPPPSVWSAIAAETSAAETGAAETGAAHANGTTPDPARRASVVPLRSPGAGRRRPRRWLVPVAAAVAGLAVGIGGTLALRPGDASGGQADTPIATVRLAALPAAPGATGDAEVVGTATGRKLVVDATRLGVPEGFYEVWLIDPSVRKMYPVGVLRGGRGEFTLPDGVDLRDFPIVDVSVEPLDGNPAHSGKSVLRGTLPA